MSTTGAIIVAMLLALFVPHPANADVLFFTDKSEWVTEIACRTEIAAFPLTPANINFANEVSAPPGSDTPVGSVLTFAGDVTAKPFFFKLRTLQTNAQFIHGDSPYLTDTLSVGEVSVHEDDDWEIVFAGSVVAFGVEIVDNDYNDTEQFQVFGLDGTLLGATTPPAIDDGPVTDQVLFVGVVADEPITRIVFDEDAAGDNIAIAGLMFAVPTDIDGGSASITDFLEVLAHWGCPHW